jgi:hypothetical protein
MASYFSSAGSWEVAYYGMGEIVENVRKVFVFAFLCFLCFGQCKEARSVPSGNNTTNYFFCQEFTDFVPECWRSLLLSWDIFCFSFSNLPARSCTFRVAVLEFWNLNRFRSYSPKLCPEKVQLLIFCIRQGKCFRGRMVSCVHCRK